MKNRKKISIIIICFLTMMPLMVQNVQATDTNLGQHGSIPGYRGSCVYYNVTETSGFEIYFPGGGGDNGEAAIGDMFKITLLGEATYSNTYSPFGSSSDDINPCIIGGMDYYNSSSGKWRSFNAVTYTGSTYSYTSYYYHAFLMYNSTSENYFCSKNFHAEKYLMLMLPTTLSLAEFGDGILEEYDNAYPTYDGVVSTTTSLNFSFNGWAGAYNYMEVAEKDGANIVQEWDYQKASYQIKAVYLNHTFTSAPPTVPIIPFGSEVIIITTICAIVLIIFMKKRSAKKNR